MSNTILKEISFIESLSYMPLLLDGGLSLDCMTIGFFDPQQPMES